MMQYSESDYKKQSLTITTALFAFLFLLLIFLTFSDTRNIMAELEGGGGGGDIAVNFGDSDVGSGKNYESTVPATAAAKSIAVKETPAEEIVTDESDVTAPAVVTVKKTKEVPKKTVTKPVEPVKQKPSKSTTDALSNILNSNSKGGDGDDKQAGNKGKAGGDPKASGYNGGGGTGTGSGGGSGSGQGIGSGSGYGSGDGGGSGSGTGNWKLAGRKLSSSSKQVQKCNEYGTVVVQISVNRSGNVIATKYTKGTTNTSQCLLEPAYATARSYKWIADANAPETQIGYITINFKLGE